MKTKKAFTLVELIVVIVILAILATIAFLSFSSQSASARDSTRLSDMSNIAKGLSVFNATAGTYPKPDSNISIQASGTTIGYQGYAGNTVLNMIKISNGGKDPLDNSTYYTYSVNSNSSKFQILGFLEDGSSSYLSLNPDFVKSRFKGAYADSASYSGRYIITKGDQLGILLNATTLVPSQTLLATVDIITTNASTQYKAVFGNESLGQNISATGTGIFSYFSTRNPSLAQNKSLSALDTSLIGYWDMESTTSSGSLKDFSKYGNNGALSGGISVGTAEGNGRYGKATVFTGTGYINLGKPDILNKNSGDMTIYAIVKLGVSLGNMSTNYNIFCNETYPANGYMLRLEDAPDSINWGRIGFRTNFIGTGYNFQASSKNYPNDKTYHMVAVSRKGTMAKIYLDGAEVSNYMFKQDLLGPTDATDNSYIGLGSWGQNFIGNIDELKIYNRPLSDSEIYAMYNISK